MFDGSSSVDFREILRNPFLVVSSGLWHTEVEVSVVLMLGSE